MLVVFTHLLDSLPDAGVERFAALLGVFDCRAVHGLNRRLSLHHTHSPGGPTEDEIGIETLAGHGVVAGAGRVIHGQYELGHARRRHRFDESGARTNDPLVLRFGANHESGDVLNEQQRNSLAIAALDEECDFLGALGVQDATEAGLLPWSSFDEPALIRDESDTDAANVHIATDNFPREPRLKFIDRPAVDERTNHFVHVI